MGTRTNAIHTTGTTRRLSISCLHHLANHRLHHTVPRRYRSYQERTHTLPHTTTASDWINSAHILHRWRKTPPITRKQKIIRRQRWLRSYSIINVLPYTFYYGYTLHPSCKSPPHRRITYTDRSHFPYALYAIPRSKSTSTSHSISCMM